MARPLPLVVNYTTGWGREGPGLQRGAVTCSLAAMLHAENETYRIVDPNWKNYTYGQVPLPPYQLASPNFQGKRWVCRGYFNRTANYKDYCGRWDATKNLDGLGFEAQQNSGPPTCLAVVDDPSLPAFVREAVVRTMQCTNEDPRTSRAGQYELQHWRHMRYCQNHQLFRVLHGRADQNDNLTACEENVRIRFEDCNTTRCLPCNPHCTQNWLETVDAVVKCGSPSGNLAALS